MDTFLAFERTDRHAEKPELVVAVAPDLAAEIDEKNDWTDESSDEAFRDELHDTLIKAAGKGLAELMNFVFQDQAITKRGVMRLVAAKVFAIASIFTPEKLLSAANTPMELRELAAVLGCPTRELRKLQRQYLRQWGFKVYVRPVRRKCR